MGSACRFGIAGAVALLVATSADAVSLVTLHHFRGADGTWPVSALLLDDRGYLYGTTSVGTADAARGGTVFRIRTDGSGVLHRFTGLDGISPWGPLIADAFGKRYGTARAGGMFGDRTVFRLEGAGFVPGPPGGVIPEPATRAMLIAGFGLVGGTLRRRLASA